MVDCVGDGRKLVSVADLPAQSLDYLLVWMKQKGSSVDLNYGEDTGQWECSWITSGRRFTYVASTPRGAAYGAVTMGIRE